MVDKILQLTSGGHFKFFNLKKNSGEYRGRVASVHPRSRAGSTPQKEHIWAKICTKNLKFQHFTGEHALGPLKSI